ncbi:Cysteine dioxygenase [Heracleum sosnowskyi]|uniref:cysteine dioxygenase n=1 Tax=Heracleum sosnowskyi TaxID=360622 RepID=A0AAD8IDU1_9APIA|nr:Cysteine dioxygenase [Heracleum sosnowskyi]
MGIKTKSSGRRSNKTSKNKNKERKCTPKVQVLYETCKEVFENCGPGIIPSPENIQRLKDVMDGMTGADVGLRPTMQIFRPQWIDKFPYISYMKIYECDKFSIGLFCLPPSAVIPLHNHPGMTVFCKLLFGKMYVNSFDWVKADSPNENGVFSTEPLKIANSAKLNSNFKARPAANGVIPAGALRLANTKKDCDISAPCNTCVLYPADGGNLHTFTAKTACAFLDVLGPPYCDPQGRHCSYYRKYPFSSLPVVGKKSVAEEQKQGYAWLEETEKKEGSLLYAKNYTGPQVQPNDLA